MTPIPKFVKGATPTLLDTDTANAVGNACNAFIGLTFTPDNLASLEKGDKTAKIAFKTITTAGILDGQITYFQVVAAVIGTVSADD